MRDYVVFLVIASQVRHTYIHYSSGPSWLRTRPEGECEIAPEFSGAATDFPTT